MEANFAKELDNGRRVVDGVQRKRVARIPTYLSGVPQSAVSPLSTLKSVTLGKRKKRDVCETKCRNCALASRRSLARYYSNFMKSGLPKRVMFYQNGEWVDHEAEIVGMVNKGFENKTAAVEVNFNNYHLVLDFVHMVQFNFKTSVEQSIAWIDEGGSCYFPEVYYDVGEQQGDCHHDVEKNEFSPVSEPLGAREIKLQIEIEVNGVVNSKFVEGCGESSPVVKRLKVDQNAEIEDSCDKGSNVRMDEDDGENQHVEKNLDAEVEKVEVDLDLDSDAVGEMFLMGMNSAGDVKVVDIFSNLCPVRQGRLELFLKQVEITKKYRGIPNVRYAWLAATKQALSSIMTYGLGCFGLQQSKSTYGIGVHLTAANCADTSANNCDVDENGERHLILCRVIMGNMEVVHAGSKQFHPSSDNYDSGVDDLQNPRHYVVWSMNVNTHIYPEYVVSFKIPANREGVLLEDGRQLDILGEQPGHQSPAVQSNVSPATDIGSDYQSDVTSVGSKEGTKSLNSTTPRTPKSPWMPFSMLLTAISKQVPPSDMKLLNAQYELFRNKVISRQDFIKQLRITVGDALLKSTITELNCQAP